MALKGLGSGGTRESLGDITTRDGTCASGGTREPGGMSGDSWRCSVEPSALSCPKTAQGMASKMDRGHLGTLATQEAG